jgi:hypothetical protein
METLRDNFEVIIGCEKESLENLDTNSFGNFVDELSSSSAGDVPNELRKADEITKGMTFTPVPGSNAK